MACINTLKVNDIYNWNYMHCEENFFFLFCFFQEYGASIIITSPNVPYKGSSFVINEV